MKNFLLPALILATVFSEVNGQLLIAADSVPVRVSYFNVEESYDRILLNWKVVCYLRFAEFEVQRSVNGKDYTTINTFTADRIRCLSPFNLDDKVSSAPVYYRLKVGDKDGNFSTSKVLVAFGREKSFQISGLTPNPVKSNTLLSISSGKNDKVNISIRNYSGTLVKQVQTSLKKGVTDITLDLNDFPKGLYVLSISNLSLDMRTAKILKL